MLQKRMSSASTQVATFRAMEIYEPFKQISTWGSTFKGNNSPNTGSSIVQVDDRADNNNNSKGTYASSLPAEPSSNDQEENRNGDKIRRRLAQNREAARKSRLRKKAYVQQLEESRLKLAQLEQELHIARQQGIRIGSNSSDSGCLDTSGTMNSGIAAFEMEYAHWLDEQHRHVCEIRNALQVHVSDIELRMLVESCLVHFANLFRIKTNAAKADVFYLMSGMWRTSIERFFQWIGGFRPSELLNVVMPHLEPLTDKQLLEVRNLQQSSQQAEDALSQGIDKLQQSLAESIVFEFVHSGNYGSQMGAAVENLQALEGFVNQADHLRQQTLRQMSKILTTRQAARGLLALGEYFHRLRALSSLWAARPRETT